MKINESNETDNNENLLNRSEAPKNKVEDCIFKVKKGGRVQFQVKVSIRNLEGKKPIRPTQKGYAPTLVAARTLRTQLKEQLVAQYLSNEMTLNEFYSQTFEQELETRSKRTAYNMSTIFKGKILPKFGHYRFSEILSTQLTEYVHNENAHLSPSTRDNYRKFLKAIFDSAIEHNIIISNPIDKVKRPKDADKPQKPLKYLTPTQLEEFYKFVFSNKHEFRYHFAIAGMTGLRVNEQRGLKWQDIQWDRNVIYVQRTFHRKEGFKSYTKNKEHRYVPISPQLLRVLQELKKETNPSEDDLVLPSLRRWETDEQGKVLHDILAILGLPLIRYYDLRSSFTMAVAEARVPVHKISEILGHKNLEMTTRYLRKLGCNLKGSLDEVDFGYRSEFSDSSSEE